MIFRQRIIDGDRLTIVAENAIVVHGRIVTTDDFDAVPGVTVNVHAFPSGSRLNPGQVQSDASGQFSLKLSPGRWLLTLSGNPGFKLPQHVNPHVQQ